MTATTTRDRASSQARFAARAASVRRRPLLVAAAAAALLLLVAGAVWLVWFSSVLAVRQVTVESTAGPVTASVRDDVVRRAGVTLGRPLARVDTGRVARSVVTQPRLASVTVSRAYPSTVLIRVTPRRPVLAARNPQGEVQLVDRTGAVYDTVVAAPDGVPVVDTTQRPPSSDSLRSALSVMQALPPSIRADVSSVTVSGANLVTLRVAVAKRSVTVSWGGADEPDLKVKVLSILLRQNGVRTIDVSAPRTPTTT